MSTTAFGRLDAIETESGRHQIDIEAIVGGYTEALIGARYIHMIDSAT